MEYCEYIPTDAKVRVEISTACRGSSVGEFQLMFHADASDSFEAQLSAIHRACDETLKHLFPHKPIPVLRRYFLSDAVNQQHLLCRSIDETSAGALSIVQQRPLDGSKVALWLYGLSGVEVSDTASAAFCHNGYEHHWSGRMYRPSGTSEEQTARLFLDYETRLARQGMTLADNCIRTWLFVQNVDVNYAGVVKARREHFHARGLTPRTHYIASTGIEGRDADPSALVLMDAYSVKGLQSGQVQQLYAPSHLSATHIYNVTFERGTTVRYGDRLHHFISGTASIDREGNILHEGNVLAQAGRMCENIECLLQEGGSSLKEVASAIVYLRDPSDFPPVQAYLAGRLPGLPLVYVHAPVCRPGWLIEMECMAVTERGDARFPEF